MKTSEIREMTLAELFAKGDELKKELFNLRIQNSTGHLQNTDTIRLVRKDISRVKTVIKEKE